MKWVITTVLTLASLVVAQDTNATCASSYAWSRNSMLHSPCQMTSYLQGACRTDYFLPALKDRSRYIGPGSEIYSNPCWCSSVTYSLALACQLCQEKSQRLLTWGQWITNCTDTDVGNGVFKQTLPLGTAIPAWAFAPVYNRDDTFNIEQAQEFAAQNSTEYKRVDATNTITQVAPTFSSGAASNEFHHGTNVGAIAGGVIGGVAALTLIGCVLWYISSRKKARQVQQVRPVFHLDLRNGQQQPVDDNSSIKYPVKALEA